MPDAPSHPEPVIPVDECLNVKYVDNIANIVSTWDDQGIKGYIELAVSIY